MYINAGETQLHGNTNFTVLCTSTLIGYCCLSGFSWKTLLIHSSKVSHYEVTNDLKDTGPLSFLCMTRI